jgi:hypothetical protein
MAEQASTCSRATTIYLGRTLEYLRESRSDRVGIPYTMSPWFKFALDAMRVYIFKPTYNLSVSLSPPLGSHVVTIRLLLGLHKKGFARHSFGLFRQLNLFQLAGQTTNLFFELSNGKILIHELIHVSTIRR